MLVIQIWYGIEIPEKYIKCINMLKNCAYGAGVAHELIHEKKQYFEPEHALKRFELASNTNELVYADCDIKFINFKALKSLNRVSFPLYKAVPDYFIFYTANDSSFFKNVLLEKENRGIKNVYGWPRKILRNKKVNIICENSYEHMRYSF